MDVSGNARHLVPSGAPATATETAQARRIASLEAHIRRLIIVATNRTMNAHGGMGDGDDAAAQMSAALCSTLTKPLPEWAGIDRAVEIPADLALWPEATP